MKRFICLGLFLFSVSAFTGCGPNTETTVSDVDDSVVHTEDQMAEMEASNAADMQSK